MVTYKYQVTKCFIALAYVTGLKLKLQVTYKNQVTKSFIDLTGVTGLKLKLTGNIQVPGHKVFHCFSGHDKSTT